MKGRAIVFLGLVALLLLSALLAGCKPKVTFVEEGPPPDAEFLSEEDTVDALNQGAEKAGQAFSSLRASMSTVSAFGGKCCWYCDAGLCCDPKCLS